MELSLDRGAEYLVADIITTDRSGWIDLLKPFISGGKHGKMIFKNGEEWFTPLKNFGVNYQSKFNIGDYVSYQNKGTYRITELPYLDIRWKECWDCTAKQSASRIYQFGNHYGLLGLDENGKLSGTEMYLWGDYDGRDIYEECSDRQLTYLHLTKEKKEILDNVVLKEAKRREYRQFIIDALI